MAIALTILVGFNEAKAQLPITESFTNPTAVGLTFGGTPGAFLTAAGANALGGTPIDAPGAGFLRLTRHLEDDGVTPAVNETGFARSTGSFTFNKGVAVQFEYFSYGGGNPGADGITFFLYNANATPFNIGAFGGSLGYAQKTGIDGVSGGFIGIGLDEYGNYAREGEGRFGGPAVSVATPDGPGGYYASAVGLRGSGSGNANTAGNYEYLTSVQTNYANAMTGVGTNTGQGPVFELIGRVNGRTITSPNIDGYRKVFMELIPNGLVGIGQAGYNVTVTITENTGGGAANLRTHTLIQNYSYIPDDAIPTNLSYGFAASTGSSRNTHEIRNIEIVVPLSIAVAPEAFNDVATTPENVPVTINVLTNDRDQNGNGTIDVATVDLDPSTPTRDISKSVVGGVFTVDNNGVVTFTPDLNFNGVAPAITYSFKDKGVNNGGTQVKTSNSDLDTPIAHATITVTVTSNNSAPSGTNKTVAVNEDGSYPIVAADFGFTDTGDSPENTLQSVILTTLPGSGVLKLSGVDQTVPGTEIAVGDLAGNLTYHPAADDFGSSYTSFTFQVRDNGGTVNSGTNLDASPNTITIDVAPVNDVPAFTKGGDQTVAEDAGAQTVNPWATGLSKGPVNEAGQTLSFAITNNTAPALFSAGPSVSSSGVLTYTPAANANGLATITLRITDDGGTTNGGVNQSATQSFTITLTPVNDAPVAVADVNTVTEDTPLTVAAGAGILVNDTDVDAGATKTVTQFVVAGSATVHTPGTNVVITGVGTINIAANGGYTFTPNANYAGAIPVITYTMSDGTATATATLTLTMTPVNDAPVAVADVNTVIEDTPLTIAAGAGILVNDTDVDAGATKTVTQFVVAGDATVHTPATNVVITGVGTINIAADGGYTFTPVANYAGAIPVITYTMSDGTATASATLTLTMTPVNDAPVAVADVNTVIEDTPLTVAAGAGILTNDTDVDAGATKTVTQFVVAGDATVHTPATNVVITGVGTINIAADGGYTFTPVANYAGVIPVITYTMSDGTATASATLTLTMTPVNDAPVAVADVNTVIEDTPLTVAAGAGILVNDTDVDAGATKTVTQFVVAGDATVHTPATNVVITGVGTINIAADGGYTFTPVANYAGAIPVITYTMSDGTATSSATLTLTMAPVNDAPSFTAGANQSVVANSGSNTVSGWATALLKGPANESSQTLSFTVTNNNNSLFSVQPAIDASGNLTYTLAGTTGSATVTVLLKDNGGTANGGVDTSAPQTFTITATAVPVNNAPPVVQNITKNGLKDQPVTFTAANFADADHYADPENVALAKVKIVSLPTSGTLKLDGVNITAGQEIPAADLAKITFVPANGYVGTVTFDWNGSDGVSYATAAKTVSITIVETNTPPIIADITKTGTKDTPVPFTATDFTSKFTDTDPLVKIKIVTLPTTGTLKLNGVNITAGQEIPAADLAKITFVPTTGFTGGPISFQWNGSDGIEYAATPKNVNITINATNTAPVAVADSYSTTKGGTLTVSLPGVLTNDTDADGNSLVSIKVTDPANGTLTLNANGSFVYTHNGGTSSSDSFTYKVNDGTVDGNTVTVSLTIVTVNGPPIVYDLPKIGTGFTPITFTPEDFKGKYTDPNSDPLVKIIVTSLPPVGTLKLNGVAVSVGQEIPVASLGSLTFEPPLNWSGTTTFGWNGFDGTVYAINPANVNVTIALAGDPTAKIGLAKSLASVTPALNATHDVKFIFTAVNYGLNGLENVSIKDNLLLAFGGATVTVKSIVGFGNLKVNSSFNGSSDTELLLPSSKLSAGEQARVELVINVKLGLSGGLFQNIATATGTSSVNGIKVTDISTNGLKPDPLTTNDVSPSDATPIQLDLQPTYVPQGFSPNGDGQNDKFFIQNAAGKHVSLEVYNRWGNRVYKSADYKNDWGGEVTEGFFVGRDIPDGTYYYIIIIEKKDKYAGFITINR